MPRLLHALFEKLIECFPHHLVQLLDTAQRYMAPRDLAFAVLKDAARNWQENSSRCLALGNESDCEPLLMNACFHHTMQTFDFFDASNKNSSGTGCPGLNGLESRFTMFFLHKCPRVLIHRLCSFCHDCIEYLIRDEQTVSLPSGHFLKYSPFRQGSPLPVERWETASSTSSITLKSRKWGYIKWSTSLEPV